MANSNDPASRITFHRDDQVMEVDFSDMSFNGAGPVNAFYDRVDQAIEETGQKWFFLVNYRNCRIMSEAWITFAHRGKKSNIAYSLGSARYAVNEETSDAIVERSKKENFDPGLFPSRERALERLHELRREIPAELFSQRIALAAPAKAISFEDRISFHPELGVMECDFSNVSFERSEHVHACYDAIERKLAETDRKWFFLVNYQNCAILPEAWITFASRGKRVNLAYSLGSVRYDASEETGRSIVEDSGFLTIALSASRFAA